MLRSGGAASLSRVSLRYVSTTGARTTSSLAHASSLQKQVPHLIGARSRAPLALVPHKPFGTSLQRYSVHPGNPFDKIDKKHEEAVEREELEVHPEEVSESSSVHQVFHEKGVKDDEVDEDMLAEIKSDFVSFLWSTSLLARRTDN